MQTQAEVKLQRGVIPAPQKPLIRQDYEKGLSIQDLVVKYQRSEKVLEKFLQESAAEPLSPQAAKTLRMVIEIPLEPVRIHIPMGLDVPLDLPKGLDSTNTTMFMQQVAQHMERLRQPVADQLDQSISALEQAMNASPPDQPAGNSGGARSGRISTKGGPK